MADETVDLKTKEVVEKELTIEKDELKIKLDKLNNFIEENPRFNDLSDIQRILLTNQFNAMELYYYALDSRIEYLD